MGFFRSAMEFFRGGARKHRDERPVEPLRDDRPAEVLRDARLAEVLRDERPVEPLRDDRPAEPLRDERPAEPLRDEAPAELLEEQAGTVTAQPADDSQVMKHEEVAAGFFDQPTAKARRRPPAVSREVKREARPNPNKPGWGLSVGQEPGKARDDDGASQG